MNNILIIVDEKSDEIGKIIDIHDKIIDKYDNLTSQYYMIQYLHSSIETKWPVKNIIFIFNIDEKEQCREFLKQCKENNCHMGNIKIELQIQHDASQIFNEYVLIFYIIYVMSI
jgi:hypothetical protein